MIELTSSVLLSFSVLEIIRLIPILKHRNSNIFVLRVARKIVLEKGMSQSGYICAVVYQIIDGIIHTSVLKIKQRLLIYFTEIFLYLIDRNVKNIYNGDVKRNLFLKSMFRLSTLLVSGYITTL